MPLLKEGAHAIVKVIFFRRPKFFLRKRLRSIKDEAEFPFLDIVSFLKLIYTAAGIDKFLLAGEEGVALIADIHFQRVHFLGGAGRKSCATCAYHRYLVIIGMDFGLHVFHLA
jgi:hypothetical protein